MFDNCTAGVKRPKPLCRVGSVKVMSWYVVRKGSRLFIGYTPV